MVHQKSGDRNKKNPEHVERKPFLWFQVLPEGFEALHAAGTSTLDAAALTEESVLAPQENKHRHDAHDHHSVPHWLPGFTLLAGFLCMLVLDFHNHKDKGRDGSSNARLIAQQRTRDERPTDVWHLISFPYRG